jgi:hypothetical protein
MGTSTRHVGLNVLRTILTASSAIAALTLVATTTSAMPRYDGLWSVSIVTEKGDCDRGYRYPIRIANNVLTNGGEVAFTITGRVMPNGAMTVTVSHGDKSAQGVGRLSGNSGMGSWSAGSCSGTWTAERRGA